MTEYEILLLLDPKLPDEKQADIVARLRTLIEQGGGTFERHDVWGRRRLAYPIDKKERGRLPPRSASRASAGDARRARREC